MDALALLCNLYGDGPATLKRLRVHGVLRIEDLSSRTDEDFARVLALPPATARRFLKEASALERRVLENDAPRSAAAAAPRPGPREVRRTKQDQLAAVAQRWGELDRQEPNSVAQQPMPAKPAPAPAATGTPLSCAGFDGRTQSSLSQAGLRTLEELGAAEADALSQASSLPISQVLFAQGLARRRLREAGPGLRIAHPAPGPGAAAAAAVAVLGPRPALDTDGLPLRELRPPARSAAHFSPSERPPSEFLGLLGIESRSEHSGGPFA